jgi:hypothetical protein
LHPKKSCKNDMKASSKDSNQRWSSVCRISCDEEISKD